MGHDRMATHLAISLAQEGHRITVLDTEVDDLDRLPDEVQVDVVLSSGSLIEDLRSIGTQNIDVALALADDDNRNAMAAQIASHIFHVPDVICRIGHPAKESFYRGLGINVLSPTQLLMENVQRALHENP